MKEIKNKTIIRIKDYCLKNLFAFWLGMSLGIIGLKITEINFWIIVLPTIIFINLFNCINKNDNNSNKILFKRSIYAIWLFFSLSFANCNFYDWQFYLIMIPIIIFVKIFNENME